jgi:hypothetical protein
MEFDDIARAVGDPGRRAQPSPSDPLQTKYLNIDPVCQR